ncbi:MAG: biopolymer transporter ExbD [Alcaligenaceae bacterium]|nr:biopolymer transporter ExbD [Alcaligenaceae bacterium]
MNFRRSMSTDEPEINLIPLIDILLVILIFLAATTSFHRYQQINVSLPKASAQALAGEPLRLAISQEGQYALDSHLLDGSLAADLAIALEHASQGQDDPVLLINADAQAPHQAVITAMEAARQAGISHVSFAIQAP